MQSLFIYIFSKSYFLCINLFKEKEFPQFFASGILALIIVGTITVLADIVGYLVDPSVIDFYSPYYKYLSLVCLFFFWWFFNQKGRYLKIIEKYERMKQNKKMRLGIVSIIYLTILIVSFFMMSELIRDYNLGNTLR